MKKKYLFTLLPLLALVGCAGKETAQSIVVDAPTYTVSHSGGRATVTAPESEGKHITYLMMSKYGRLTMGGQTFAGSDVEEKYYENCIVYKSDSTSTLPKEEVSHIYGATFRGWSKYNDNTYPDYYTNVPEASGTTLYAIFDGGTGGGGGSGGGDTPVEPANPYTVRIEVDLTLFSGWEGISGFSVYVWGSNGEQQFGDWKTCTENGGNLQGTGNIKSVTKTITGAIVGAIFTFNQTGGDYPGIKQTTDMLININESGVYQIAPKADYIEWVDGKMANFTISYKGALEA